MKEGIHPKYEEAVVTCACGNTFTTRSTKKEIHVEVCSKCHPFYTGKQKLVDTGGRVDRFKKRFNMPLPASDSSVIMPPPSREKKFPVKSLSSE